MKLILCKICNDVVALSKKTRSCECGASSGNYKGDGWHAIVRGPSVVYGVNNKLFVTGRAEAFLYPEDNGRIERR